MEYSQGALLFGILCSSHHNIRLVPFSNAHPNEVIDAVNSFADADDGSAMEKLCLCCEAHVTPHVVLTY
jgi:hypothetical protein